MMELRVTELEARGNYLLAALEAQNAQLKLFQHARWHNDWQTPVLRCSEEGKITYNAVLANCTRRATR